MTDDFLALLLFFDGLVAYLMQSWIVWGSLRRRLYPSLFLCWGLGIAGGLGGLGASDL
jgi:hypothetical protein